MRKYLVEFEFKTDVENHYWFPLFLNADNSDSAEISAKTVQTAIEQHYTLKRRTKVQPIINRVNAEIINEYIQQRQRGQVVILEFDVWRFKTVQTIPELNFDEHLELVEYSEMFSDDSIATTVARHKFPVRLYYSNPDLDFKEFLLVNVVDPSNVADFHIVVELTENDFKRSKLQLIQEGIWKDAYISGYNVRVDAPHTPDGKRHVHIAHSKHINSKNKQVSWNDDLTRHDKKSFDQNFKGLERAKEIVRKELGLDDNAILENLQTNGNLLIENIQLDGINNDIIYLGLR